MDQKIPKPKRLQEWYKKMLDKAVAERIVHDYKVLPGDIFARIHTTKAGQYIHITAQFSLNHPTHSRIWRGKRGNHYAEQMSHLFLNSPHHVCHPPHHQDVFKQATEDRLTSAKELPYFEGDFWPNVLEESIKELEQEEEERKREENSTSNESIDVRIKLASLFRLGGGRF